MLRELRVFAFQSIGSRVGVPRDGRHVWRLHEKNQGRLDRDKEGVLRSDSNDVRFASEKRRLQESHRFGGNRGLPHPTWLFQTRNSPGRSEGRAIRLRIAPQSGSALAGKSHFSATWLFILYVRQSEHVVLHTPNKAVGIRNSTSSSQPYGSGL